MTSFEKLHAFILAAKAASYVDSGDPVESCRPESHDLAYQQGQFSYLDSYFGGSDFIGEEVVYQEGNPVWAMNYYGVILKPEQIEAAETGQMIKTSLAKMYAEGRFLGGWQHAEGDLVYFDTSEGNLTYFTGREWIEKDGEIVYQLVYHGGLIR